MSASAAQKDFAGFEPRPTRPTPEMMRVAAIKIANELAARRRIELSEIDARSLEIAKQGGGKLYADGYNLAKDLERFAGWQCNLEMAEVLNDYGQALRDLIAIAERDWAQRTNPQPPYPVGTRVSIGAKETGEITGIYKYGPAKYEVAIDGDIRALPPICSRRIINFEDATPEAAPAR